MAEMQKDHLLNEDISLQIEILKKLKSSPNIVIFIGFTNRIIDGNFCQYLVIKWLEYRSLKEFYTKHKELMMTAKKLEFAIDIARGLNFLTIVGILHHNVRSENIFVEKHGSENRKFQISLIVLCNKILSKEAINKTKQIKAGIYNIRYMAPEILDTTTSEDIQKKMFLIITSAKFIEINQHFILPSFGMLLWEIAKLNILNQTNVPMKYQKLTHKAVQTNAKDQPNFIDLFVSLEKLYKHYTNSISSEGNSSINSNISKSPEENSKEDDINSAKTVEDALKEHMSEHGNKKLA
ncbi:18116_t:CDS:2 [Acaulospora morrowiae]|uniref:18116_t:CDS:1 n=1 Tax=Acaulospora morrowiae TaxID=94023 RepID=A0A9N9NBR3_9GLOM|nr:18116_t:CDS:2 [Acaulospora morrowiae]